MPSWITVTSGANDWRRGGTTDSKAGRYTASSVKGWSGRFTE
jgi:hypothetical protein